MDYILRDIDIELWSKVKANPERKTMREVIFEGPKRYISLVGAPASSDKNKKEKKRS